MVKPPLVLFLSICCGLLLSAADEDATSSSKLTKKDFSQLLQTKRYDELDRLAVQSAANMPNLTAGYALHHIIEYLAAPTSVRNGTTAWAEHLEQLEGWVAHSPKSVFPRIALGNAYVSWAWSARGNAYADQVTKEGWDLFSQRLGQANTILSEAEKISAKRPELYAVWLTVAYALDLPQQRIDEIFNKGRAADRDDTRLYYTKARFLLPRWYGKPGDWEKFAAEMANDRGGKQGDVLYMLILRSQASTEGDAFFEKSKVSYSRMKKGFEARLNSTSDELGELNTYCYFACIAGDKSTARSLFRRIDSKWRKSPWKNEGRFQNWKNWAEGSDSSN